MTGPKSSVLDVSYHLEAVFGRAGVIGTEHIVSGVFRGSALWT